MSGNSPFEESQVPKQKSATVEGSKSVQAEPLHNHESEAPTVGRWDNGRIGAVSRALMMEASEARARMEHLVVRR